VALTPLPYRPAKTRSLAFTGSLVAHVAATCLPIDRRQRGNGHHDVIQDLPDLAIGFDPCDLPPDRFLVAGAVWQRCRDQGEDARRFGFNARLRGLPYIRDNMLRDLLALNKREVLYTDRWWGDVYQKPINRLSAAELTRHDRLAALTSDVDTVFAELR
jgi:hypothetical protein